MPIWMDEWLRMDQAAALSHATRVAAATGGELAEFRMRQVGERFGPQALISIEGTTFSLVPGGSVQLGYDAWTFRPTKAEVTSFYSDHPGYHQPIEWDDGPEVLPGQLALFDEPEPRVKPTVGSGLGEIREYLSARLTRPRTATLPDLLVAVDAVEAGVDEIGFDDQAVLRHLREHPWQPGRLESSEDWGAAHDDPNDCVRIQYDRVTGDPRRAWRARRVTHEDIVAALALRGWRLPSPDEWEHACGAGATTLFPWGERVFDEPKVGEANLLGLRMAVDSYMPELTSIPAEVRGSDLGESACGGYARFYQTVLRARCFRDARVIQGEYGRLSVRHRLYRPVIEV